MDKLLIKRGSKRALEQLDPLSVGELFLAKDEERLYVGGPRGNISLPTQKEVDEKATKTELQQVSLAYKESYDTLDDLKNAYPNGDVYNHVVLADGMIYTYVNGEWISTGVEANGAIEFMKAYEDLKVLGVGGRNLFINSDFYKTYKGNPFTVDGKTYDTYPDQWGGYNSGVPATSYHAHIDDDTFGFNVVEFNESNGQRNWKGIHQSGLEKRLNPAQTGIFTFSVDVYATGTGTRLFGGFHYFRKSDGQRGFHSGQFNIQPTEVNKWVRMSAQCRLNDDVDFSQTISFYIYGYEFTTNSILYIKNVKLEYGNKATDWTPAPEDIDAHPFVVELAETVFRSKQKDWEKAYEDLKILGVGGRNLLTGTSKEFKKINIGNFATYIPNSRLDMGGVLNVGDTVTFRAYIKAPQGRTSAVRITEFYSDGDSRSFVGNFVNDGYSTVTYTIGERNPNVSYILLYFGNDKPGENSTYDIEYKEVKLEYGNKATDWTPAPEDIDAHPFVVELAETVFRSKQNEERIRNLEEKLISN